MTSIAKPIRIEPAFDEPEQIRAMFERHAPYPAVAAYGLDVFVDGTKHPQAERAVLPWFRGNWALGGKPLVEGAEVILHNRRFLEAAKAVFGTSRVYPEWVVVNVNAPMPAGPTHVDVPCFYGATREHYPLPFLVVMGSSGLFEPWRVVQAGAVSWFYDGTGGNFDYWPEGLDGPMVSEQPPFSNVALIADNDRMRHRIGAIGDPNAELPRISASAHIQPDGDGRWAILENGEVRATYPGHAIRLSVVWKAAVRDRELSDDNLTLDRIMATFTADLRHRSVDFQMPSDPLADTAWILPLQRIYGDPTDSREDHFTYKDLEEGAKK
jgi:hypothetical protein